MKHLACAVLLSVMMACTSSNPAPSTWAFAAKAGPALQAELDKEIRLKCAERDYADVLTFLREQTGVRIVEKPDVYSGGGEFLFTFDDKARLGDILDLMDRKLDLIITCSATTIYVEIDD